MEKKKIAGSEIKLSDVFYIGWWFGEHTYGDYTFKQERRDEIFKSIADPAVDEIISRGIILPGATDDDRWDVFIKECQPRLEDMIASNGLDSFDIFYIGWWFGFRGCP